MPSVMAGPAGGSAGNLDLPPPPPHPPRPPAHLPHPPPPEHQQQQRSSLREQQVLRLRQEMAHPAGVRLTLRRRDCQNSLALVELFGFLWVAGWKQKEYPVLYNAFHIGDQVCRLDTMNTKALFQSCLSPQIMTVGGVPARTASDFQKAVKTPRDAGLGANPSALYVEVVVRRVPFGQVFHLRREVDGQPLGIVTQGGTSEVRKWIFSPNIIISSDLQGKRLILMNFKFQIFRSVRLFLAARHLSRASPPWPAPPCSPPTPPPHQMGPLQPLLPQPPPPLPSPPRLPLSHLPLPMLEVLPLPRPSWCPGR